MSDDEPSHLSPDEVVVRVGRPEGEGTLWGAAYAAAVRRIAATCDGSLALAVAGAEASRCGCASTRS